METPSFQQYFLLSTGPYLETVPGSGGGLILSKICLLARFLIFIDLDPWHRFLLEDLCWQFCSRTLLPRMRSCDRSHLISIWVCPRAPQFCIFLITWNKVELMTEVCLLKGCLCHTHSPPNLVLQFCSLHPHGLMQPAIWRKKQNHAALSLLLSSLFPKQLVSTLKSSVGFRISTRSRT